VQRNIFIIFSVFICKIRLHVSQALAKEHNESYQTILNLY
jgi:hypothetical protein